MTLSDRALSIWGKTDDLDRDEYRKGLSLPLHMHLLDTGYVAGRLYDALPPLAQNVLQAGIENDSDAARRRFVAICALHDIGKATPEFLNTKGATATVARERIESLGLEFEYGGKDRGRHEEATLYVIDRLFGASARSCAIVAASHHGFAPTPPKSGVLGSNSGRAVFRPRGDLTIEDRTHLGWTKDGWYETQQEIAEHVLEALGVSGEDLNEGIPHAVFAQYVGLVMLADWIASDTYFFPLGKTWWSFARGERGWDKLDPSKFWSLEDQGHLSIDDHYRLRFPSFEKYPPYPMQRTVARVAREATEPSLVIIESGMGSGKTEAGLLAAEVLTTSLGGSGIAIALPTMATTNAALDRALIWANHAGTEITTFLGHGRSSLSREFIDLLESPDLVHASKTLSRKKMGLLSTISASTVDQIAKMSLRGKSAYSISGMLTGKTVIFDEVHSYDPYTALYVMRSIEMLAAAGSSVIILSATLDENRRNEIIQSYETGVLARDDSDAGLSEIPVAPTHYPLITSYSRGEGVSYFDGGGMGGEPVKEITVEVHADSSDEIITDLIREHAPRGGCISVIRSTVKRSQSTYASLCKDFGVKNVTLLHGRFTSGDREDHIREIESVVGVDGSQTGKRRGEGEFYIVVSTQIIEQSMDFDFDYMISDLAPLDALLQRSGRNFRHGERHGARPVLAPRIDIVSAEVAEENRYRASMESGGVFIYSHYQLHLAGEFLSTVGKITTPGDIPDIVARMISDESDERASVRELADHWRAQESRKTRIADSFATESMSLTVGNLHDLSIRNVICNQREAETKDTIRDADGSVEGLLLVPAKGGWKTPSGSKILTGATDEESLDLGRCTIRLKNIIGYDGSDLLVPEEWKSNRVLRGRKIIPLVNGKINVGGLSFTYNRRTGLVELPKE